MSASIYFGVPSSNGSLYHRYQNTLYAPLFSHAARLAGNDPSGSGTSEFIIGVETASVGEDEFEPLPHAGYQAVPEESALLLARFLAEVGEVAEPAFWLVG